MAGVIEMQGLGLAGIDTHHALSGHVDETARPNRPFDAAALEPDRRGFDAEKLSDETRQRGHRATRAPARNRGDRIALLGTRTFIGDDAHRPVSLDHRLWRPPENDV